jgi:MFS family permease
VFSGVLRLTTIGVLIVVTMIAFEAMAVTTAMPTAARELGGLAHYAWAFAGFIVANLVGIAGAGVLGDRRGPRPPLVIGLVAFLSGLLLAGAATTMTLLICGRVVQGFGAGTLITAIYVVIGESYTAQQRPKVFALMSSAWVVPGLAGPPLSGLITQHFGWRWVFLALAPIALAGALLMVPRLRSMPSRRNDSETGDGFRRLLRAVAVACGIAVLLQAGQTPGPRWIVPVLAALASVAWGLPGLLPPGTFALRAGVPATVALRGLLAGSMFGADAFIPLVMTVQHGWSPATAGLPLVGGALTWSFGSWWQGRDVIASRRAPLVRSGFACLGLGLLLAAVASSPQVPGVLMYVAWAFAGLGAGLGMTTISVLMLGQTTDADRSRDSAALQLSDGVVSALTIGFGGVLIAAAAHAVLGYTTAFVVLDLTMVLVATLGLLGASRAQAAAQLV